MKNVYLEIEIKHGNLIEMTDFEGIKEIFIHEDEKFIESVLNNESPMYEVTYHVRTKDQ